MITEVVAALVAPIIILAVYLFVGERIVRQFILASRFIEGLNRGR